MHSSILISALALVGTAFAAPLENRASKTTATLCTQSNFGGLCAEVQVSFNKCYRAPYHDNVGSFKPAPGALCRLTTTAESCTAHGDLFVEDSTGISNLYKYKGPEGVVKDYGHSMTSFLCQECTGCK